MPGARTEAIPALFGDERRSRGIIQDDRPVYLRCILKDTYANA